MTLIDGDRRAEGLSSVEALARLARDGPNELARARPTRGGKLVARQFTSPLVWLLGGAALLSAMLGEIADAVAIGAVVCVNAAIGFVQDWRAERALFALRSMTAPRARVRRDGRITTIGAAQVVRGDLLLLEAGDVVAADGRLIEANLLSTNEAALTGESLPVEKLLAHARPSPQGTSDAASRDRVFMGTTIAAGTGVAEVTATGTRTELGRIGRLLTTARTEETPLQRRLARVARGLLYGCLGLVFAIGGLGVLRGLPWLEVLLSAVSLAVAAVPEGLPAIVTIALALGVRRLSTRHVLVRRLPSVETLGCVTVICTDKTGTLTTGIMAVRETWGGSAEVTLRAAAACCDAVPGEGGRPGSGDPMELAILAAAKAHGVDLAAIERDTPRRRVAPFDPARRRMAIWRTDGRLYVKGAVEELVPRCETGTEGALAEAERLASRGLRVLAVAVGEGPDEDRLHLLGLVGISDPPRPEAVRALAEARRAGIRTVMITGDHPATARAIGVEMGLIGESEDPSGLIHARATAADKLEIVRAWKRSGAVVAMTGDGVNDAPALKEADIGIAMGLGGTEVTRETADLVLTDDDYTSIVEGIREGRGIYANLRKTLEYLLAGNVGELALMLAAAVGGLPPPLLPLQLLWINLVTDALPALALVTDPPRADLLDHPPRPPGEPVISRRGWLRIGIAGGLEAALAFALFTWALPRQGLGEARDLAFTTVVLSELLRALAARDEARTAWELGLLTNGRLLAVVGLTVVTQLGMHLIPPLRAPFGLAPFDLAAAALSLGVALAPVSILELAKVARRSRRGPDA